jgi:uncharacterized protein
MKKILVGLAVLLSVKIAAQQQPLKAFPLSSVILEENSPFHHAQQTDLKYILELDPDRLLAPFLIDAGIPTKAERYGNWENTGLDGHIGGHYLSALSFMYASTANQKIEQRLGYMIDKLAECQQKNGTGYVGGIPGGQAIWKEIAQGKIEADNFSLNKKWVPLYNIHKLFAGLRDAYIVAGNKKALDILVKLADWFLNTTSPLSDDQIQQMLRSEHGGMNEVFADIAVITGNDKYLAMAKKLSHRKILDPLIAGRDELTGIHANTQIPKVVGYKRIADLSKDTSWSHAADFFWNTVVKNRSISIGGNSVREHFNPPTDFSSMLESNQGPETCNSYNMLRLTNLLFLSDPQVRYMDYYERTLYNHILSSQHPNGGFVYFTPIRPMHYRVYSQPQQSFWCCVGSGLENHGKYGEMIFAHNDKDIYVNLFIASTLQWKEKGITLKQTTSFPYSESSSIKVTVKTPSRFRINIRHPEWVKEGELKIRVNGKDLRVNSKPSSFASIDRQWTSGDLITVNLPMRTTVEYLPDQSSWASFVHGPIVLAAPADTSNMVGLLADDSRMGHEAKGKFVPIEEAPMIIKKEASLSAKVKQMPNKPLRFSASEIIYPVKYRNLELKPFFEVHDARYMMYWQVTSPENLEKVIEAARIKEKESLALEASTIDKVAVGEQQPEVEHNFKGARTELGNTNGQAWRTAQGWFSYDLKNENKAGKFLKLTYDGRGGKRKFDVLINDVLVKTIELDASTQNKVLVADIEIPAEIINSAKEDRVTVKFAASENSSTGRIFFLRLVKSL